MSPDILNEEVAKGQEWVYAPVGSKDYPWRDVEGAVLETVGKWGEEEEENSVPSAPAHGLPRGMVHAVSKMNAAFIKREMTKASPELDPL
jgi:hypothetical protein